jgi:agmatine/peptidylarginine deiminase
MILEKLQSWYFQGYENEKTDIDRDVVARFSRGNILVQQGHYLDLDALKDLSRRGDEALTRLADVAEH